MTNSDHAVVITTTDSEAKARVLAGAVVNAKLAACAQVYAISSIYRWEGKVEQDQEWRIDFKTRGGLVDRLSTFIAEHHDYDEPEIISLPVTGGSPGYLAWVTAETRS
ncbi:divalent-cation tolerance protein CutA [Streptomyces rimosus]|uniref:divalent-cation tolerance protein CutA n=1 Tax=Streptomyces rimosus TaxID=1927 RepID=UPI0004C55235|nr:divalent-cation tolerance protein CutA [Streptomyces rimosus]